MKLAMAIARTLYSCGISFSLNEKEDFQKYMAEEQRAYSMAAEDKEDNDG
jgi:hypothetical protein